MNSSRKAAIQEYKERKVARGIFAIRCTVTRSVWVESAMDLSSAENRVWFALKHVDAQIEKSAVAEFQAHGRDAFSYEVLEKIDEDTPSMSIRDVLKDRKLHWLQQLEARKLWPV